MNFDSIRNIAYNTAFIFNFIFVINGEIWNGMTDVKTFNDVEMTDIGRQCLSRYQ